MLCCRSDLSVGSTVIFWLTSGLYFTVLLCNRCGQQAFIQSQVLNQTAKQLNHVIEDTLNLSPTQQNTDTMGNEYEHPALREYVGAGRTLQKVLAHESVNLQIGSEHPASSVQTEWETSNLNVQFEGEEQMPEMQFSRVDTRSRANTDVEAADVAFADSQRTCEVIDGAHSSL